MRKAFFRKTGKDGVLVRELFLAICLSMAIIFSASSVLAAEIRLDYHHLKEVITEDALWAQIESAVKRALKEQKDSGSFEQDPNAPDIGDNNIGVVSLLAFYNHETGGSEEIREAAVKGLEFWLKERVRRQDPRDTRYITKRNSGEAYTPYMINGDRAAGDFPTTAWSLLNTCHVLFYADFLESDLYNELLETACSLWRWLTEVSVWDPQNTQNQAIGAIVGGLKLSELTNDPSIKEKAIQIYETKIRPERVLDRGYMIFHEHGGFDAHYSSMSLHFVAEAYLHSGYKPFLDDGIEMAKYIDMRMSQNGYDYGGTRWDEAGRNDADAFFVGFSLFDPYVDGDMGRYLVGYRGPDTLPAERLGHYSMGLIPSYVHFKEGSGGKDVFVDEYAMRKGRTSITFSNDHLPYLISVGNVDFLESVIDGVHGNGFYYGRGNSRLPAFSVKSTKHETLNFDGILARRVVQEVDSATQLQIGARTMVVGSGDDITTRSLYVLDGEELYVLGMAGFNKTTKADSVAWMIGLPYLYMKEGEGWKVTTVKSGSDELLLSLGGRELTGGRNGLLVGDVKISGGPAPCVQNPDWADARWTFNSQLSLIAKVRDVKYWKDVQNTNHFMLKTDFAKTVSFTSKDTLFFWYRIAPDSSEEPTVILETGQKGELKVVYIQAKSFVYIATGDSYKSGSLTTTGQVELLLDTKSNEYVGYGKGNIAFQLNGTEYKVSITADGQRGTL